MALQGKYGGMVIRTLEDAQRILAMRKKQEEI